ncbi:hypothetical protein ACRRVA_02940 [Candidatus Cardinium hertigii]|uniref:hypothetical protein n=1 Tax=Candidatus Cardinium hertigii TaxID=247481 RepID=UPI003D7DE8FF
MKKKYYTSYFSAVLPIGIVCFLIMACSKVHHEYATSNIHDNKKFDMKHDTSCQTNNKTSFQEKMFLHLLRGVEQGNKVRVENLLKIVFKSPNNIIFFKKKCQENNILYIAAGINENSKNKEIQPILELLLDKLTKNEYSTFSCKNSLLVQKNSARQTAVAVAAQSKNIKMLKCLLVAIIKTFGNQFLPNYQEPNYQESNIEDILCHMKSLAPVSHIAIQNSLDELEQYIPILKTLNEQELLNHRISLIGLSPYVQDSTCQQIHRSESDKTIRKNGDNASTACSTNTHNSSEDPPQNSIKKPMQHNMQKRPIIAT